MNRHKINARQLFAMIMLFEFGTALVIPIGLQPSQSVWLSILLAIPGALGLYLIYDHLFRQYPDLILSGYIRRILGRVLGIPIVLLYILFFIYNGARNLREAGDLLVTSSYDRTPLFVIHAAMIIVVMYVLSKGLEVLFRLGEIYFIIMICIGLVSHIFILFSGIIDLRNLLPIQGEGWGTVVQTAYPYILLFPFGELICFAAVFPHLNHKDSGRSTGFVAIISGGVFLSITHAIEIAVLGHDIYSRASFPLFTTISVINIADFIQRVDVLVMLILIIGVFFKMSVYLYAAKEMISDLFGVKESKRLVIPVCVIALFSSVLSAWSYPEHAEEGKISIHVFLFTLSLIIPVLLVIVNAVRKRLTGHTLHKRKGSGS